MPHLGLPATAWRGRGRGSRRRSTGSGAPVVHHRVVVGRRDP
ncbi:hypothetical protein E2C01_089612 [Portunus trituberculatus]|uniref:Uncharacterized protein n=1 Tax=Portunus trituberculatus TaxID=210409 RepID=A0A5B7JCH6_PORTR|nr:hypothetical protein [Portunus trituberculatus]